MSEKMIRQCELRSGPWVTVTWIPDRVAHVGNTVTLRGDLRPWTVVEAYERIEERLLNSKHHRLDGCFAV